METFLTSLKAIQAFITIVIIVIELLR